MIAADRPGGRSGRLLAIEANGEMQPMARDSLASLFQPGDLVVANDAATLPASLHGFHEPSGEAIELRLAAWLAAGDPTRFVAIAFGGGDHRTSTEERAPPPALSPGDRLSLGPLAALVEGLRGHPRMPTLRFDGERAIILAGLARHGRPIQYAHIPAPLDLWDVWTNLAADPVAFEPPSSGFALDWRLLAAWRRRGIAFATLTHAAGISSTGDPVLDRRLPFDEPYVIPQRTVTAVDRAKAAGKNVVAIGTTVVRALEAAADADDTVRAGAGTARNRIGRETGLRIVDVILTGMHEPGESHFELLRAFADDRLLERITDTASEQGFRTHEFGDQLLLERRTSVGIVPSRD